MHRYRSKPAHTYIHVSSASSSLSSSLPDFGVPATPPVTVMGSAEYAPRGSGSALRNLKKKTGGIETKGGEKRRGEKGKERKEWEDEARRRMILVRGVEKGE